MRQNERAWITGTFTAAIAEDATNTEQKKTESTQRQQSPLCIR
jgi:hypothetical protein